MKVFLYIAAIFSVIFLIILFSIFASSEKISIPKFKTPVTAKNMRRKLKTTYKNDVKIERKDLKETIINSINDYYTEAHVYYPENIRWLEKRGFKVTLAKYDNTYDYYTINWRDNE